jgi:integrase
MKKSNWPKSKQVTKNGKKMILVDARIGGKGERRFFDTKAEADGFVIKCRIKREQEGARAIHNDDLARYGWTVQQAIDFALVHLKTKATSKTIADAIDELVDTKARAGKTEQYQRDIRSRLARLADHLPEKTLAEISTADLDGFLLALPLSPGTRNTFRRDIRTLWAFAEKRGYAFAVTAKNTERATVDEKPPEIFTTGQAAALMIHSKGDIAAFHAIGLFAGLRVAEIKRLTWADVDLLGGYIHVSAKNSKTRARRLVPILPNLAAWLRPLAQKAGPICQSNFAKRQLATRAAAGIKNWPDNGLRHSFVSYRLAATNNAAATALEAGHDQAVLFAHYRELVRPADAEKYFAIQPEAGVVPMGKAAA